MELDSLYQEVILDHGRKPRNFGALPDANREAHGHNPLCGDKLDVRLKVKDGIVEDVMFEGAGCAISAALCSTCTPKPRSSAAMASISASERCRPCSMMAARMSCLVLK